MLSAGKLFEFKTMKSVNDEIYDVPVSLFISAGNKKQGLQGLQDIIPSL